MEQCQEIDLVPLDLSCPDHEEISDEQLGLAVLANVAEVVEPIIPVVDAIIPAAAVIIPTVDPEQIVDPEPTVDLSNIDDLLQSDSGDDLLEPDSGDDLLEDDSEAPADGATWTYSYRSPECAPPVYAPPLGELHDRLCAELDAREARAEVIADFFDSSDESDDGEEEHIEPEPVVEPEDESAGSEDEVRIVSEIITVESGSSGQSVAPGSERNVETEAENEVELITLECVEGCSESESESSESERNSSPSSSSASSSSSFSSDDEMALDYILFFNKTIDGRTGLYRLGLDVPINDGSWCELEDTWNPHVYPEVERYDNEGRILGYKCKKRRVERAFNGGCWEISLRLAITEHLPVFFSSCEMAHGCGTMRLPVAHVYQAVAFLCDKPEVVFVYANRKWGKRCLLNAGMNYILFCTGELRFAQRGAYDVPRPDNLESEGVTFAADIGTRWVTAASPYLDTDGALDPDGEHPYGYVFSHDMPPPTYLIVCPEDGMPSACQNARAMRGESHVKKMANSIQAKKSHAGQAVSRSSYFRLFLKPVKRAGHRHEHGFLMT